MRALLPIGRFARITRLTIKALHVYEALGLLQPVCVDASSGYRYYSITQLPLARRIRLLRSIDMPLPAIRAIVDAPTPETMDALLGEHRRRIEERIARDRQALHVLHHVRAHQADALAAAMRVKSVGAQPIAGIRFEASPAEEASQIQLVLDELEHFALSRGVRSHDSPALRVSHAYSAALVDTEIAVPLTRLVVPTERVGVRMLEASVVAYAPHVGPRAELWAVYWALLVWIEEHGLEQHGAPREIYVQHPAGGTAATYRTEVQWPVRGTLAATPPTGATNA